MKKIISKTLIGSMLFTASVAAMAEFQVCTTEGDNVIYIKEDTKFVCTGMKGKFTVADLNAKAYKIVSLAVSNYTVDGYNNHEWAIAIQK